MGYTIARWIFKALLVCLTIITIPLAIALIQVLVALPRQGFPDNLYRTILGWFFLPGASVTGTLSITGTLLFLLILTGIITAIGEIRNGGLALKKYLHDIAAKNSGLKPVGFSQQSALISVSVPLDDIFIHLLPLRWLKDSPTSGVFLHRQPLNRCQQTRTTQKRRGRSYSNNHRMVAFLS